MADFDALWNYNDPAATEIKFRELLPKAAAANDPSYLAQLQTQIARTLSLRARFDECHALLDCVEATLTPDLKLARVRLLLERGRAFNSSGKPQTAEPLFTEAWKLGEEIGEWRLAIDAVHMIAIAKQEPREQIEWNLRGIALAERESQKGWLFALYNNIGESYALVQDYASALEHFQKLINLYIAAGKEPDMYTVKDVARMQRLTGHPEESLALMQPILAKLQSAQNDDGYIRNEIAEALHALGRTADAKPHFAKALELLSQDAWFVKHEAGKIARLKELSA